MGHPVRIDGASVFAQLVQFDREPFTRKLVEALTAGPTYEAMQKWAQTHPDRWAQCIAILGRLAGYSEQRKTHHTLALVLAHMSDSEIRARIQDIEAELAGLAPALPDQCGTA